MLRKKKTPQVVNVPARGRAAQAKKPATTRTKDKNVMTSIPVPSGYVLVPIETLRVEPDNLY